METTMFNYYFDKERGEQHEYTKKLFEMIREGVFEAYTSSYVVDELKKARKEKCDRMLELIIKYNIRMLKGNKEADRIGKLYLEKGVIPKGFLADAMHIATATVYGLDIIASMNFEHIVRPKTIRMTGTINIENGYNAIVICSAKEVVKNGIEDRERIE